MPKKCQGQGKPKEEQEKRPATPTFLLELPLVVDAGQAARLRAHLEAARHLYNALLSEGQHRLRRMRADPTWQEARTFPRTHKTERAAAFSALRKAHGFTEAALHEAVKGLRVGWIAEHVEAVLAQTLATRAYRALNRVCLGKAKRVRFKSRGRGFSSIENKRNDTGLRFVLQPPEDGNAGYLLWNGDQLPALIDWKDEVVTYGLRHRIKYARLIQRPASSKRATGADEEGYRYVVQLALEGKPHHKPKHTVGKGTVGGDLGPSSLALVPQEGEASLEVFCAELAPDARAIRRLQRQMDRQRRAGNPEHYDEKGRIKKQGNKKLRWKQSKRYQATRRRKATKERKLAAHRKSLHGRKVHEVMALGNTIVIEKISYKTWQKQFGKSVGLRAPGMFVELLRRTVASTGGTLVEVSTRTTALSQWCHGCGRRVKKPLSQRWHQCECGIGPVQRDLYSAFLAAYLDPAAPIPSCARYQGYWEGAEARLRAAHERTIQRAKEGQSMPRSFGLTRAGARLPKSSGELPLEPALRLRGEGLEAWNEPLEPPRL
ncbi:zinc ribbon domain-containing protein [Ktedonobacter racemifer]|uniref:Transposase IS605 OrfB n=1 Tax=Ktedonobacter racemifer DSM 44963 TaxID=485913 RepID=D6TXI8_KTERA|nr:zinc ribbon domain-containing protein [Ktedonobacter racemifer]EFH84921.1 transposase IS605 OrfB [Ktedonobacter racemifer DSM 44963]